MKLSYNKQAENYNEKGFISIKVLHGSSEGEM